MATRMPRRTTSCSGGAPMGFSQGPSDELIFIGCALNIRGGQHPSQIPVGNVDDNLFISPVRQGNFHGDRSFACSLPI